MSVRGGRSSSIHHRGTPATMSFTLAEYSPPRRGRPTALAAVPQHDAGTPSGDRGPAGDGFHAPGGVAHARHRIQPGDRESRLEADRRHLPHIPIRLVLELTTRPGAEFNAGF